MRAGDTSGNAIEKSKQSLGQSESTVTIDRRGKAHGRPLIQDGAVSELVGTNFDRWIQIGEDLYGEREREISVPQAQ